MMKKILCGLLAASLAAGALVSCGSDGGSSSSSGSSEPESSASASESSEESGSSSEETSTASGAYTPNFDEEPYTIYMQYMVNQENPDHDRVAEAINELTLSEMNMNIELIPQSWGVMTTNIPMMLAAGERLDLFFCLGSSFGTYIESGYLLNWADYLDYIPDVVEGVGDYLDAGYIEDFLVGIPMMKERASQTGLIMRKDYTDEAGFSPDDFNITTEDFSSYDKLDELFDAVKANHPDMTSLAGYNIMASMPTNYVDGLGNYYGVLENFGQTTTVTNYFESEEYLELCKIARRWFEKGYLSADAATSQDGGEQLMKLGLRSRASTTSNPTPILNGNPIWDSKSMLFRCRKQLTQARVQLMVWFTHCPAHRKTRLKLLLSTTGHSAAVNSTIPSTGVLKESTG